MSCGVGCKRDLDLAWLWLWCRLAAVVLIRPLAWELPCAAGAALERKKQKNKKKTLLDHEPLLLPLLCASVSGKATSHL